MVYLFLLGLFVGLLAVSRRIVQNSLAANFVALGQRIVAFAVGYFSGWLAFELFFYTASNLGLRILIASAVGLAAFGIMNAVLSRWSRRNAWTQACASALRLPTWIDRASGVILLVTMWGGALIAFDLWTQLQQLAKTPQGVSQPIGPPPLEQATAGDDTSVNVSAESVHAAMLWQNDFLNRFQSGLKRSREDFYTAIGTQEMLTQVKAIQQINALPQEDKIWLIEKNPKIAALANHPTLLRIVGNDSLVANLERVGGGSITAIYEIGADSDVCELLEDPEVLRLVREIELHQLLEEVQQHQRRRAAPNSPN